MNVLLTIQSMSFNTDYDKAPYAKHCGTYREMEKANQIVGTLL
jgi:hypothetical protein